MEEVQRAKSLMAGRFAEVERVVAGLPATTRRLAEIQVSETSADGLVTATVDLRGQLLDLRLDPRIYRVPDAGSLAETIVALVARAARRAGALGEAALRDLLPRTGDLAFSDADLARMLGRGSDPGDRDERPGARHGR